MRVSTTGPAASRRSPEKPAPAPMSKGVIARSSPGVQHRGNELFVWPSYGIDMNITLRQLQAFCTVARLGSFTKAANALHTTQPALSVQIGQLEDALGLRLFDRTTRTVAITRVGEELLPRAERTLAELAGIVDSASGLGAKNAGRIVVAALPSVASSFLPEAIASFRAKFPNVQIVLR